MNKPSFHFRMGSLALTRKLDGEHNDTFCDKEVEGKL